MELFKEFNYNIDENNQNVHINANPKDRKKDWIHYRKSIFMEEAL